MPTPKKITKEMKEYSLHEMELLIQAIRHRPIECYSTKVSGQDKKYYLSNSFCENLIDALKKQYK